MYEVDFAHRLTSAVKKMVEIDLVGVMYIWSIDLNALSTVNLVMCVGISGAASSVPWGTSWWDSYF